MRVTRALLTFRSRWNSSNKNQRCFFGFSTFSVCLTTNDFTRANSFLQPFAKSRGPYSNSTTKQKARTAKRTSQNNPRSNAMAGRLACSEGMVNAMGPYSTSSPPRVRPVADKIPRRPPSHDGCAQAGELFQRRHWNSIFLEARSGTAMLLASCACRCSI